MLSGLAQLNLELTSRCDKTHLCPMCGHQDQAINPITYGDMDIALLKVIRLQLNPGITISFHRDGEPTAYPRLREGLEIFSGFTVSLVTHGLNLGRLAEDIIGRCTTVTVSVFRGDQDARAQLDSLARFLQIKGDRLPQVQVKIVGDMLQDGIEEYEALGVRVLRRLIHVPIDNSKYAHRSPVVPEVGICLDALHRPTIAQDGRMYLCNRLDAQGHGYIGDANTESLEAIWNGPTRQRMIEAHKAGRRDLANPLCATCKHWGTPSA
jgi:radical SAM protein with 4Fe4S-binding SPASM domain